MLGAGIRAMAASRSALLAVAANLALIPPAGEATRRSEANVRRCEANAVLAIRSIVTGDRSSSQLKKLVGRNRLAQVPVVQVGGALRRRHVTGHEDLKPQLFELGMGSNS